MVTYYSHVPCAGLYIVARLKWLRHPRYKKNQRRPCSLGYYRSDSVPKVSCQWRCGTSRHASDNSAVINNVAVLQ